MGCTPSRVHEVHHHHYGTPGPRDGVDTHPKPRSTPAPPAGFSLLDRVRAISEPDKVIKLQKVGGDPSELAGIGNDVKKWYDWDASGTVLMTYRAPPSSGIPPPQDLVDAFRKTHTLMTIITAAMSKAKYSLYDSDEWSTALSKSGFFMLQEEIDSKYSSSSTNVDVHSDFIGKIFIGMAQGAPAAMATAKAMLSSLGSYSTTVTNASKRVGRAVLLVELMMGIPVIHVMLISSLASQASSVHKSGSGSVTHSSVTFDYKTAVFMFVDPTVLHKFAGEFGENPELDTLVDSIAKKIGKAADDGAPE